MKLNIKAFSIAVGLTWGIILAIITWSASLGWQAETAGLLKSSYVGMEATFLGGIVGFIWGFVSGVISGFLISYFYNRLVSKK